MHTLPVLEASNTTGTLGGGGDLDDVATSDQHQKRLINIQPLARGAPAVSQLEHALSPRLSAVRTRAAGLGASISQNEHRQRGFLFFYYFLSHNCSLCCWVDLFIYFSISDVSQIFLRKGRLCSPLPADRLSDTFVW